MTVLSGGLGVSQDLVSSGQMGFVALALLLRHHDRQDHLCCGGPEAGHLRTQPPEHVALNGLPHFLLMMLLRRCIKILIRHCLWIQVSQALHQGVIRCLHIGQSHECNLSPRLAVLDTDSSLQNLQICL